MLTRQAHPGIVTSNRKVLPFFVTHYPEVLERCKRGASSCSPEQVEYLAGFGHLATRIGDAWRYICQLRGVFHFATAAHVQLAGVISHHAMSLTGHYPGHRDSRNHPKVPLGSQQSYRLPLLEPLAADHNPHVLLGNTSVAANVLKFSPENLKFILLCCHPAKRACMYSVLICLCFLQSFVEPYTARLFPLETQ
eukprot:SAG31_NODE_4962_length_2834_cov_1.541865_2_plen_194_part_00